MHRLEEHTQNITTASFYMCWHQDINFKDMVEAMTRFFSFTKFSLRTVAITDKKPYSKNK